MKKPLRRKPGNRAATKHETAQPDQIASSDPAAVGARWPSAGEALWVSLALILINLVVYAPLRNHDFLNYDDPEYVTENPHVTAGLTWNGIWWALTTGHAANWHPLTWLSHMLDVQMYGLNPGPHHVTNVILHIANTLLLFWLLHQISNAVWRSAFVAALFAVHPLHVESVAWVAERKDVLSTLFWMLTLCAYVRYVRQPRLSRYLHVLAFFALGLMAKPMLVTLPFVLLLLDYWPLGRSRSAELGKQRSTWDRWGPLLLEKVPFFALAAVTCVLTISAQREAIVSTAGLS